MADNHPIVFSELKAKVGIDDVAFALGYRINKRAEIGRHKKKDNMKKKAKVEVSLDQGFLENAKKLARKHIGKENKPQLVTVNGDKITNAHAFRSFQSGDWLFMAKINGKPLKPQLIEKDDVENVLYHNTTVEEMIAKYYPNVGRPKAKESEFMLPKTITTANGEEQVLKFNAYKKTWDDPVLGKCSHYRFYAQVGEEIMTCRASTKDLDAYFNKVTTPIQLITKNFGDKLGIKTFYEQFQLPEGMNIEEKNILITKNQESNRYEISVKTDHFQTPAKELSYDDRKSYFHHNVATKEQLAAKYLSYELESLSKTQKPFQQITENFGDKLGIKDSYEQFKLDIKAYYEQFKLPEGMEIEGKNILITKNPKTNRYEISVKTENFQTSSKIISYDDRKSYFHHNVATKEQLAAKYLSYELESLSKTQKPAAEKHFCITR